MYITYSNKKNVYIIKKRACMYIHVCKTVLINILMSKLCPQTKILNSTPFNVNDHVETLIFPLGTPLDLIGI